jgi:hypothetical protein
VGHPLEIDRILGDERNYAGSSFVKLGDFGNLIYGSEIMNISFDPTISGEYASYGFDDVGMPATKEFLIKDGLLTIKAVSNAENGASQFISNLESFNKIENINRGFLFSIKRKPVTTVYEFQKFISFQTAQSNSIHLNC